MSREDQQKCNPCSRAWPLVAPLFPDMIQCMAIQVLEIKKSKSLKGYTQPEDLHCLCVPTVVYLYLINYARSKSDEIAHAIPGFLSVSINWIPFPRKC
jgi:hypothetical protein